jgi:hypothetical protein
MMRILLRIASFPAFKTGELFLVVLFVSAQHNIMLPKRKWAIADEAVKKKCVEDILAILDQAAGREPGMLLAEEIMK